MCLPDSPSRLNVDGAFWELPGPRPSLTVSLDHASTYWGDQLCRNYRAQSLGRGAPQSKTVTLSCPRQRLVLPPPPAARGEQTRGTHVLQFPPAPSCLHGFRPKP